MVLRCLANFVCQVSKSLVPNLPRGIVLRKLVLDFRTSNRITAQTVAAWWRVYFLFLIHS